MASKTPPRFYTSKKTAPDRVGEIMGLLAKYPAAIDSYHVLNEGGKVAAFAVSIQGVGYRFQPQVEGVRRRMEEAGAIKPPNASPEAVAWAQMYTLVEMQLEAVANGVASVEEVFGGWAIVGDRTVGQMIRDRRGELMPGENLLLTSPATEVE